MNNKELNTVKRIIERENDIETLTNIRMLLDKQIDKSKNYEELFDEDNEVLRGIQLEILSTSVFDFYEELRKKYDKRMHKSHLIKVINYYCYYEDIEPEKFLIRHLIEIGGDRLSNAKGIGDSTIQTIEMELNKSGLSLYRPLPEKLKKLRK